MKTKLISFFSAIIIGLVAVSCSSDNDNPGPTMTFPEAKTFTLAAGETQLLEFTASHEFTLTCEGNLVRFISGDPQVEVQTVYGDPGANSFKILVKDTGIDFTDKTSIITMKMGNEKPKTIYTIVRSGLVREAKIVVFDLTVPNGEAPREASTLDFLYTDSYQFSFTANFKWKLKSQPDWLEELSKNTFGNAGEKVIVKRDMNTAYFVESKIPFAQTGEFVLEDVADPTHTVAIPVTFDGLPNDRVNFTPMNLRRGVDVNDMGMFTSMGSDPEATKIVTAIGRNMFIRIAHVSYDMSTHRATEITADNSWVKCVENSAVKGEYTLTVEENTTNYDRTTYLYFLPEKYKTDAYPYTEDFPEDFFNSSYGVKITQQGKPFADFFTFSYRAGSKVVSPAVAFPDADLAAAIGISVDNIYKKVFKASEWVEGDNLIVKVNLAPGALGGQILEDVGNGISIGGTMYAETGKTFTFFEVKPYADLTQTIVFFTLPGDQYYLLVLEKE